MTPFDPNDDALLLAQRSIPERENGAPLFRRAWHARAFALIVTLVKQSHLSWTSFQERLVVHLAREQAKDRTLSAEDIDLQYFDCWLAAIEETLIAETLIDDSDIAHQIAAIRRTVQAIRHEQMNTEK